MADLNGKWETLMKTPMGPQKGTMDLKVDGNVLTGTADGKTGSSVIQDGKVDGDSFSLMIESKSPMGLVKVTMEGKVEGDTFTTQCKTPFGNAVLTGKRIA